MKLFLFLLISFSATADFIELLEQAVFQEVSTKLQSNTDIKSYQISDVTYLDMDRNAEYYVQASWIEVSSNDETKTCQADYFLTNFNRSDLLIQETSRACSSIE